MVFSKERNESLQTNTEKPSFDFASQALLTFAAYLNDANETQKAISIPINESTLDSFDLFEVQSEVPKESILFKYATSFLAASCAELVTYPLDLTKTRLQLQGEAAVNAFNQKLGPSKPELKRGMLKTAFGIVKQIEIEGDLFLVKEEGFFKLWRGMPPAVNRHLIYSGTRLTVYELIRDTLGKNEDGTLSLWKAVCGGVIAGGFAQFLASPADLVKVQIQAEGKRRMQGLPPRVRNSWHAFTKIINEGGVRGLWKGWVPNVQRAALVNLGDLTTYDTAKRIILNHTKLKDNYFTHALARQDLLIRSQTIIDFFHSTFSGLVAATFGTPADTIKTRIMNQPTDEHGRGLVYKGSIDCFMKCVKQEGFFSLYKGFIPCWMRMGPWSLTFWITYEKFRNWGGVKSF